MSRLKHLFLYVIVLSLLGCATPVATQQQIPQERQISQEQIDNARRQQFIDSHQDLPLRTKQNILKGTVHLGMTKEMVVAALGNPNNIKRAGDASGIRETWVYYSPLPDLSSCDLTGLTPEDIALALNIAQSRRTKTYLLFQDGIFTNYEEQ